MLLLKFLAHALQRIGDAGRCDTIAGMHSCNILKLVLRESREASGLDFTHVGWLSWSYVNKNVDLLSCRIGRAFRGNARPIIAVLLHKLMNVLQGAVKFVYGVKFAELEFGCIDN